MQARHRCNKRGIKAWMRWYRTTFLKRLTLSPMSEMSDFTRFYILEGEIGRVAPGPTFRTKSRMRILRGTDPPLSFSRPASIPGCLLCPPSPSAALQCLPPRSLTNSERGAALGRLSCHRLPSGQAAARRCRMGAHRFRIQLPDAQACVWNGRIFWSLRDGLRRV